MTMDLKIRMHIINEYLNVETNVVTKDLHNRMSNS